MTKQNWSANLDLDNALRSGDWILAQQLISQQKASLTFIKRILKEYLITPGVYQAIIAYYNIKNTPENILKKTRLS